MTTYEQLKPILDRYIREETVIVSKNCFDDLEGEINDVGLWLSSTIEAENFNWDADQKDAAIEALINMRCAISRFKKIFKR